MTNRITQLNTAINLVEKARTAIEEAKDLISANLAGCEEADTPENDRLDDALQELEGFNFYEAISSIQDAI